ncbi:MAG: ATP-binding protein [Pseudomonadota bacterium]
MTHILITTGPESCGKTTLAIQLGKKLHAPVVTEASRDWLNERYRLEPGYQYQQNDLLTIARLQHAREQEALAHNSRYLVCDTDLLVIVIWSEVVFGNCDSEIIDLLHHTLATTRRTYLLCDHHIPWQYDPLRVNPFDRDVLFALYLAKLESLGAEFITACGNKSERVMQVLRDIAAPA